MDPCNHPDTCNCLGKCKNKKPDGYECCVEKPPPNVDAKFGTWVRNGSCDTDTGHCKTKKIIARENYGKKNRDSCKKWRTLYLMSIFIGVLLGLCTIMYCCSEKD